MKRLLFVVMLACIGVTAWAASKLESGEAAYVQAQRGAHMRTAP